jgi:hypothetical protein
MTLGKFIFLQNGFGISPTTPQQSLCCSTWLPCWHNKKDCFLGVYVQNVGMLRLCRNLTKKCWEKLIGSFLFQRKCLSDFSRKRHFVSCGTFSHDLTENVSHPGWICIMNEPDACLHRPCESTKQSVCVVPVSLYLLDIRLILQIL